MYSDMADPGRDGEEKWNTGAGIIERLGGRGPGNLVPPGVCERGGERGGAPERADEDAERAGENARCMSDV